MLRTQGLHRLAYACIWRSLGSQGSVSSLLKTVPECQTCGGQQQQQEWQHMPACLWPSQQQQQYSTTQHTWQQNQQSLQPQQQQSKQKRSDAVLKLYKGNWILPVRFLVRAKVFQVLGGGSLGLLLGSLALGADASFGDIVALTALAGGMAGASCCLWYYSRRYVGEMALMLPDAQRVRFAVLDFWGNREDVIVPIAALTPPFKDIRKKEMERLASQILFPLTAQGDRQYYVSIHAGTLLEPQVFLSILKGEYKPQEHPPVVAAQEFWQHKLQQQAALNQAHPQQQPYAATAAPEQGSRAADAAHTVHSQGDEQQRQQQQQQQASPQQPRQKVEPKAATASHNLW